MNPHASPGISPVAMVQHLWRSRELILSMTKREVGGRYKGSVMGLLWSFLNPLLMLSVYTFVFSFVFKSRWPGAAEDSHSQFAIILFVGLIVHGFFAEVLTRSPTLVLSNVNYVKRVVFPLEILPAVAVGAALFHCGISLMVLLIAGFLFNDTLPWTVVLIPIVLSPLLILTLGVAWLLASLGVFVRDIAQTVGIIAMMLMFLSPVFFPTSTLPEQYRPLIHANPLTLIIEQAREVLIWGRSPDWSNLGLYMLVACLVAWLGFVWFQKTRKGFADVL